MTEPVKMSESEWNEAIDKWYEEQRKQLGIVTIPGIGMLASDDPSYLGVQNQNRKVASEDLIRHYAYAIGDPNPLWQNPEYARNSRYGGIIAPPTFEAFIAAPFTTRGFHPPYMGRLMSGVDHRYYEVIRAGDEFRVLDRTYECVEKTKPEKGYRLFLVRSERKYINQHGRVAAIAYGGAIALGFPPGKADKVAQDAYKGIKKRRLTQEELDALHHSYEDEIAGGTRRGAEILYWEDVVEGEELKPLAAGPLDIVDCAIFDVGIYLNPAFGLKWYQAMKTAEAWRKSGSQSQLMRGVDPVTGEIMYGDPHLNEAAAQLMENVPGGIALGSHVEGLMAKLVCNWMGDDGFVKRLDCQMRNIWLWGHILWLKGKVVRKYIENREPLVDLELEAVNQDGLLIMPCKATVRLFSREHPPEPSEAC